MRARIGPERREGGIGALTIDQSNVGAQRWTKMSTYGLFHILVGLSGREVRRSEQRSRGGEDIGAVDQSIRVVSQLAHGLEDELEAVLQLVLVGCDGIRSIRIKELLQNRVLTAERLPLAGGARITGELSIQLVSSGWLVTGYAYSVIRLETEFTLQWGQDSALNATLAGEGSTT